MKKIRVKTNSSFIRTTSIIANLLVILKLLLELWLSWNLVDFR